GIRSFSDDPELTGALGDAFIRGLHESGTLTAVKHYPGHGDTLTDSHTNLPVMNSTLDELRQLALVPFATCVDDEGEQTDFVMAAHICFPQIESGTYQSKLDGQEITLPATFSRILITDILRDELGFDGVVITDSMQMKAIADHFTPLDAARLALNAGVDMLLMPVNIRSTADIGEMETYIRQVAELVRKGEIPQERIEEAVLRVLMMKDRYGLLDIRTQEENEPLEERIRQAQEIVGSEAHHAAEWELALQAVTLVKDTEGLLPLSPKSRVILACPDSARFLSLKYALYRLQEDQILPEDADVAVACYEGMSEADATNMAWQSDVVVVVSSVTGWKELGKEDVPSAFIDKLIQAAHGLDRQVIVISSGLPYDVNRFPDADAVLACYSPEGMKELPPETEYGANLPAAIYSLFSGQELSGRLPVEIPALSEYSNLTE
ncbi:MAG: hypothetical protein IJT34_07425, partial [Butyrivibrio sp.]|nr:hypothetical protein [Butyrivibrio sp.]